jgi:DNA-binding transcriptional regulator YiaG
MTDKNEKYHYTECGLDNVWLVGDGVEFVNLPGGRQEVRISDVEGLHREICRLLIQEKKNLTGKELRFLRQEMLLSQSNLAKLLEVAEQTIHRWESGKSDIPRSADAIVRMIYCQQFDSKSKVNVRECLEKLADLDDAADSELIAKTSKKGWQLQLDLAA